MEQPTGIESLKILLSGGLTDARIVTVSHLSVAEADGIHIDRFEVVAEHRRTGEAARRVPILTVLDVPVRAVGGAPKLALPLNDR